MADMGRQLLDAAAELFAERGYDAVSMRDISKVVGVTQANLYYHFQHKADLIQAALAHVFELRGLSLRGALDSHSDDPLGAFVRWFVEALMTDKVFAGLLYRELLDGDAERIGKLCESVLNLPFQSITIAVGGGRSDPEARSLALSYVGFILGQVLVLPLAPSLTGEDDISGTPDAVASRLLALIRARQGEA
jgi:AcrR family transcriptional regulator